MATATIQVAYEAETSSLKASVDEINKINDKVVQGAQESAQKVKKEFNGIANSFAAAFGGKQTEAALNNQEKAISKLATSGKSLTGQLRQMKQELAALESAGQDGTEAFNKLLVAAAKLEDQIGDTRAKVKILASDTFKFDAAVQATQGLAAGFEVAQGAAALFGGESEDLQKTIAKVTAATAVANGVSQIANLIKEESTIKTAVLTAAQTAYNVVVGNSTGLMKAFRIALAATGVGALAIGLIALVQNFDKLKDAINGTSDTTRALDSTLEDTKKALGGAIEQTTKVGTAFELAKKGVISKEEALVTYNETLGGTFGKTTDLNVAEANYIKKKDAYIAATAARAQAQALFAQSAVLAAEAATASQEDVRGVGDKILAFANRANAAFADLLTIGLTDASEQAKKVNNDAAKFAQERVKTEKEAQSKIILDLGASKLKEAETIENAAGIISEAEQKILDERAAKNKAAAEKALEATKKAAEDQAKAREQLRALENEAFINQLDAQSKILNDSNTKVAELEKAFREAKFKEGSDQELQAQKDLQIAIEQIKKQAGVQLAEVEKATNEKILKDKLDAAKAAEGATLQEQLAALQLQESLELESADALGKSKVEIATRYAVLIGNVTKQIDDAVVNTQINNIKRLEIEQGTSLDRRIELIKIEAEKRKLDAANSIKDEKERASAIELIEKETQKQITDETNKEIQDRTDKVLEFAKEVSTAFAALNDLSKASAESRIADIQAASDKELEAVNNSTMLEREKAQSRIAIENKKARMIAEINRRQAVQDKALALFNIGISTSEAIMKFLVTPGGTRGIALSILAGITGAAQAAAVIAKPIPKFERGGLIGGKLHSQGGTLIEAEQGEYMVNRRQSAKHRRELDAMNHSTEAFRRMIDERYVRPALMSYSAGRRGKDGVVVNASLNSKSMEKELRGMRKDLKSRNVVVNINQQDSRYLWQ
jgi:hypothetical protein